MVEQQRKRAPPEVGGCMWLVLHAIRCRGLGHGMRRPVPLHPESSANPEKELSNQRLHALLKYTNQAAILVAISPHAGGGAVPAGGPAGAGGPGLPAGAAVAAAEVTMLLLGHWNKAA